tara:strand:+ start:3729 stop:4613 length:885 start_codon:yes stop_codon:yes gene_type:complete
MSVKKLIINDENEGRRLDNFLLSLYKNVPKTKIYKIIRKGEVRVNSSRTKPYYKLRIDDLVRIPPIIELNKNIKKNINNEDLDIHMSDILYEDQNFLIINKKRGIVVHGGSKNLIGLIDIARERYGDNIDLCHRLDKNTTGCLVFGKNKKAVKHFNEALFDKKVTKIYQVILKGNLHKDININTPVYKNKPENIKESLSKFKIIKTLRECTFAEVQIYTGRTHQIRIHSSSINHPVLFDNRYGDDEFNKSIKTSISKNIALHSKSIVFKDLKLNVIEVNSPMPEEFQILINELQ